MNYVNASSRASQSNPACRALLTSCFAALICAAAIGCGDDDDNTPPDAGAVAGKGGSGGKGGAGGSAVAGSAAPQPVPCGSTMCTPPANPLTGLLGAFGMGGQVAGLPAPAACCLDEASGKCGTAAMEGAMCEAPAVADSRCMGFSLGALGGAIPGGGAALGNLATGCCTESGMCGLDGAIFGRGCVENSEVKAMLGAIPFVGNLLMVPAPIACDHPIITEDAGAEDAGL
jgi:hypothetical protein